MTPMPDALDQSVFAERHHLGVHSVSVFVRDVEVSLRFYVDCLGFNIAFNARLPSGERWTAVAPPDGTALLALLGPEPSSADYSLIGRRNLLTFVSNDVMAKFNEWSKRGVRFAHPPRTEHWGGTITQFEDPDGNSFGLVGHDTMTQAIEAQRRAEAEKAEAERRLTQELAIAKQVQARLFPQILPLLATLDYAGVCVQARQVGGDYYDFLDLGKGRLGFVIGDISGKGIAAALLMAHLQANIRSQSALALDNLPRLLRSANRLFCENTADSAYATLFFAEYDDRRRRFRYANCGHLSALLLRAGGHVEWLESTGTVLGLFKQWDCRVEERSVFPGDILVLYTDGVTESFSEGGEEFGEDRLVEAVRKHRHEPLQALLGAVVEELRGFSASEQFDDITLIAAKSF
jgi:serine phosphatase RsbU (regulator of sigma subunit)/predicted enzyme related to lactoylglutathione lyase